MKKNKLVIGIIVVVLLVNCFLVTSCDKKLEAIRVDSKSEAPTELWQALESIEMKPGVYFFSGNFLNNGQLYFAVCGEEKYKNNYNVEINDIEYDPKNIEDDKVIDGLYHVDIVEEYSSSIPDYCSQLKYPFILFKIKLSSSYDELTVTNQGIKETINYWWGADITKGEANNFSYEVIVEKDEIPTEIWSEIEVLDLERGIFDFEQRDYGTNAYYALLCGGEEYKEGYQIAFERYDAYEESSKTPNQSKDVAGEIVFTIHEYSDKGMLAYAKGFEYPFVVIKVQGRNDKVYTLMGGVKHFINTYNNSFEANILRSNWEMRP